MRNAERGQGGWSYPGEPCHQAVQILPQRSGQASGRILPISVLPDALARAIGPVLTAASFGPFLWAVYTLRSGGASIPTNKPTDVIVVRGPYRFSRNPIYLAMVFLQLGIGVWANSLWFFVLAMLSALLLAWGVISREERYLERKFGDGYLAYKARVRRWL